MSKHYEITEQKRLTQAEYEAVKASLDNSRDSLIIRLLMETGARGQEILNLKAKDIDLDQQTILIHGVKGSAERCLPIRDETFKHLKSFINETSPDTILFNITTRRLRQIWTKYKPPSCKKGIHALRHTFAINLFRHKENIRLLQMALGHRSINNTMVYSSYVYKTDELKRMFEGMD